MHVANSLCAWPVICQNGQKNANSTANGARSLSLAVLHRWARTCKQPSGRPSSPRQMQVRALTSTSFKKLLLWQTRAAELNSRMLVTLLSVLFYYYPSLLTTILSLFACYRIDPEYPAADELYPEYAQVSIPYMHHLLLLCSCSLMNSDSQLTKADFCVAQLATAEHCFKTFSVCLGKEAWQALS